MKKKLAFFIASFFGVGYAPFASGPFGSLASFILIYPAIRYFGWVGLAFLTLISFFAGWIASHTVLKYTEHDPGLIVMDEVAGQSLTMLILLPSYYKVGGNLALFFLLSFILFRFFDIKKPLLVGYVDQRVKNSFGVMFDDILAGIFAGLVGIILVAIFSFYPPALVVWTLISSFLLGYFHTYLIFLFWKK